MEEFSVVRKVTELKPHPKNDWFFDDIEGEKWEEFLTSIQRNGVITPLIITPENVVVSGNQRLRACIASGIKEVKCFVMKFDSEDEVVKVLIETNIRQRGVINSPSVKLGRILAELERIYGTENISNKAKSWRKDFDVSRNVVNRSKTLAKMTPEAQELVEDDVISAQTAYDLVSKLSDEEQRKFAELVSAVPGMRLTLRDAKETIEKNFPDSELVKELQDRLVKAQEQISDTELELRGKLDEAIRRERSTYEQLQREKKGRKRDAEEFERRMDASEKLLDDSDSAAGCYQTQISDLKSQLAEEQEFAASAQSDADLNALCAILTGAIGGLTEMSNDPAPLLGYDHDRAVGLMDKMEAILGKIRNRLGKEVAA